MSILRTKIKIKGINDTFQPKDFKDNCTNTAYKRPFIEEKFAKDLHCENLIKSIRNKYKDPFIEQKRLKKLKIRNKLKIIQKDKEKEKEEINLPNKNAFFYCIPNMQHFDIKTNKKKLNNPKIKTILIRQRSDFDLPKINKYKSRNISQTELKSNYSLFRENATNSIKDDEKNKECFISEMMEPIDLYKNKERKISICSYMNKMPGNQSLQENYKVIKDINMINDKYNLKLNIFNKNKSNSQIFDGKKYTRLGRLSKLFQFYSSETNNSNKYYRNNNKFTNSTYRTKSVDLDPNENKIITKCDYCDSDNNTFEILKDTCEDDSNTFLTKLNNYNFNSSKSKKNEFNVSRLIKKRCSLGDIKKNNEEIINNDKMIYIDCLISKINKDISVKKILYKYIDKTLYEFEDNPSYKRIKVFENNITNILKNKY